MLDIGSASKTPVCPAVDRIRPNASNFIPDNMGMSLGVADVADVAKPTVFIPQRSNSARALPIG